MKETQAILNLPFDQYQRYKMVQEVIESLRDGTPLKVLDVGGYPGQILDFLPGDDVLVVDMVEDEKPHYMRADALSLPFEDASFDITMSVDVFEHIRPEDRGRFLSEMRRVSRRAIILAAPFETQDVPLCEILANNFYKGIYGDDEKWLKEHIENGLPGLDETVAELGSIYPHVAVFSNGYLNRWLKMITVHYNFLNDNLLRPYLTSISRFYNEKFYPYDNKPPSYRKVIVASNEEIRFRAKEKAEDRTSARNEMLLDELIENMQRVYLRRSVEMEIRQKEAKIKEKEEAIGRTTARLREIDSQLAQLKNKVKEGEDANLSLKKELEKKEQAFGEKCEELIETDNRFKAKCVEVVSREKELSSLIEEKTGIAGELKDKEERIAALEGSAREKDSEIESLKESGIRLGSELNNLMKRLEEKEQAFQKKCEEMIGLDNRFKAKCVEVVSKEKELSLIVEEKTGIAGELREKKAHMAAVEGFLKEREKDIANLRQELFTLLEKKTEIDGELREKERGIAALEDSIRERDSMIMEREKIINGLLGSMSWKITKPLRTIKDFLQK